MSENDFDCVVIGGGVGGMCAAAMMAHYGYRTLVAEKRPRLGGRFSTMEIDGFKCPTGAAIVTRGTELEETFKVTGADFDIVKCSTVAWQIGDKTYDVTGKGMFKTLALLLILPPRLYKFAFMTMANVFRSMGEMLFFRFLNLFRPEEKWTFRRKDKGSLTSREWTMKYTDDPVVIQASHAFLSALFNAINDFECPASDVFAFAASMANPFKAHTFGYARRGNVELMDSLGRVVEREGGEVLRSTEVKEIKMANGRVTGVVLSGPEGEREVSARTVISNAGPSATMEMVGEENYPQAYVRKLNQTLRPAPIVMCHVASDVPLLDHKGLVVTSGTRTIVGAVQLTLHTTDVAPPGQHLLWTFATPSCCTRKLDVELERNNNLEDLETAFPLYKEHGRLLEMVIKDIDDDLPCLRTWPGYDMPVTTPIPNLFNVGDGVKDFGWTGCPACAKSAWKVVEKIRRDFPAPAAGTGGSIAAGSTAYAGISVTASRV